MSTLSGLNSLHPEPEEPSGYLSDLVDRLYTLGGRAEWQDQRIPIEHRVRDFMRIHERRSTRPAWQEIEPQFRQHFPGVNTDAVRRGWEQQSGLAAAREKVEFSEETTPSYILRRSLSFGSDIYNFLHSMNYRRARERYEKGEATPSDFRAIAEHERLRQIEQERTTGENIVSGVAHVPSYIHQALLGGLALKGLAKAVPALGFLAPTAAPIAEAAFPAAPLLSSVGLRAAAASAPAWAARTAAMTAMMPSMYLERATTNAEVQGGSWASFRNLAPAFALGFLQVGVLGQVARIGHAATGVLPATGTAANLAGRYGAGILAGTATGMAGQQMVDVIGSGIADVLPYWKQMHTGYGILGAALEGKSGDAWKHVAVQAATFAAFSLFHAAVEGPPKPTPKMRPPVLDALRETGKQLRSQGISEAKAGEMLQEVFDRFTDYANKDPSLGRTEAMEMLKDLPDNLKPFGRALADTLPEHMKPVQQPQQQVQPPQQQVQPPQQPQQQVQPQQVQPPVRTAADLAKEMKRQGIGNRDVIEQNVKDAGSAEEVYVRNQGNNSLPAEYARQYAKEMYGDPQGRLDFLLKVKQASGGEKFSNLSLSDSFFKFFKFSDAEVKEAKEKGWIKETEKGKFEVTRLPLTRAENAKVEAIARKIMESPDPAKNLALLDPEVRQIVEQRIAELKPPEAVKTAPPESEAVQKAQEPVQPPREAAEVKPEPPKTIQGQVTDLTNQYHEATRRTMDAEARVRNARPAAEYSYPEGKEADAQRAKEALKQAEKELKDSRKEEKQLQKDLNAKRDELMMQPKEEAKVAEPPQQEPAVKAEPPQQEPAVKAEPVQTEWGNYKNMGSGVVDSMYDAMFKGYQEGKTTEAGNKSVYLQAAQALKSAGRELTRSEFQEFVKEIVDKKQGKTGQEYQDAIRSILQKWLSEKAPEEAAKPVEAAKPEPPKTPPPKSLADEIEAMRLKAESMALKWNAMMLNVKNELKKAGITTQESLEKSDLFKNNLLRQQLAKLLVRQMEAKDAAEIAQVQAAKAKIDAERQAKQIPPDVKQELAKDFPPEFEEGYHKRFLKGPQAPQQATPEAAKPAEHYQQTAWTQFVAFVKEIASHVAPRTARASEPSANALAEHISAPEYAKRATPVYIDKVLGPEATPEVSRLHGSTFLELRFRTAAKQMLDKANILLKQSLAEADPQKKESLMTENARLQDEAGKLLGKSFIGKDGSPLKTEVDYQRHVNSPEFKSMLERYKTEFVPEMEKYYRMAEGLDVDDPINSLTQIPGAPIHAFALQSGETATEGTVYTGGGRGNLRAPKQGKLGFAKQFKGSAEGYETDMRTIIERTLAQSASLATKANMYRTYVQEGVAEWGPAGKKLAGMVEFKDVNPPKGTQEATQGQTSLYVRDYAAKEFRKALATDQRFSTIPGTQVWTKVALAAAVEAATHSKNLLTFFFKPGVSKIDFVRNAYNLYWEKPELQQRVLDLVKHGMGRPSGLEVGEQWGGKYNPMNYVGKFLEFVDTVQRLTGREAFARLKRQGRVIDSELNERNFVNQLGQYNKRAQNDMVVFLRDTGIGPFATAGTNFMMQGLRALLFDPGVKAPGLWQAAGLRGEMAARILGFISLAPLINYLLWGKATGDENTPFGAIKYGESAAGETQYLDLGALTGFTRGARTTGLLAIYEGIRRGESWARISENAAHDVFAAALHPASGPAVQFAHTVMTGRNAMGATVERTPSPSGSHLYERLRAAALGANPLVASMSGVAHPHREASIGEKLWSMLGPYGLHYRADVLAHHVQDRLRELTDARQFHQRSERTQFPEELEYQRLRSIAQTMTHLQQELRGLRGTPLRQGELPDDERSRQIRQRMVDLARRVIGDTVR